MTGGHQSDTETRIRATMQQLLTGTIPTGLKCDVKSLCVLAGVPRATLYRAYPHLKADFDSKRATAQDAGEHPDPRVAQIQRLKDEVAHLRERLTKLSADLSTMETFRSQALSRLAAQHEEIIMLRSSQKALPGNTLRILQGAGRDNPGTGSGAPPNAAGAPCGPTPIQPRGGT